MLCMPVVIVAGVCWFFVACHVFVQCVVCVVQCVCLVCIACLVPGPVWVLGLGWWCGVTSCEGRMVDALASRADEGRRSLR